MHLTETHQIRPNHKLYSICDELCFKSKNLYNAALFEFRQSYFNKETNTLSWQNINKKFNQGYCNITMRRDLSCPKCSKITFKF